MSATRAPRVSASSTPSRAGIQVDVRVLGKEEYGAALLYFTGSKEHNVAMRTIAVKRGLKVSEYGVFKVAPAEPGHDHVLSRFTPKDKGKTVIKVDTPAGFTTPENAIAVPATVSN